MLPEQNTKDTADIEKTQKNPREIVKKIHLSGS
jgi:hypothetical protein